MTDLYHLPAHELVRLMSNRTVSCREVIEAHPARIDAVNPGPFNCYGPLARAVKDLYLGLSIMSGPVLQGPYAVPAPLGRPDEVDLASLSRTTHPAGSIGPWSCCGSRSSWAETADAGSRGYRLACRLSPGLGRTPQPWR